MAAILKNGRHLEISNGKSSKISKYPTMIHYKRFGACIIISTYFPSVAQNRSIFDIFNKKMGLYCILKVLFPTESVTIRFITLIIIEIDTKIIEFDKLGVKL